MAGTRGPSVAAVPRWAALSSSSSSSPSSSPSSPSSSSSSSWPSSSSPSGASGGMATPTQQPTQYARRQLPADAVERVERRDWEMRVAYDTVKEAYPEHSFGEGAPKDALEVRRKRLIYRSKQRGWLEVDLLLGLWADKFVPSMDARQLDEFERILNLETIDLYNYVSGKDTPPEAVRTETMTRLQEFAKSAPLGRASPEAYAAVKKVFSN